jgi:PHP family Zn ribbon phosphoesterase
MALIADLHIHGKFSQATSKALDISSLEKYARMKGVDLLGTGDFTHPKWIEEIKDSLSGDGSGIFRTASGFPFMLTSEISLVYTQGGKGRRVHNVVLAPDLDSVSQITDYLLTKGRVDYDGRPIFKIPCPDFVEQLHSINPKIEVIPAHIWTPWFSMFGSKSGFDSVKDCFLDQTRRIHALETGLSSDPPMNWRLSQLDNYNLVSFSDLHSFWPWRLGRESTLFEVGKLNYSNLLSAIRTGDGLKGTIEVDPNYGKYHFDGHRKCGLSWTPWNQKRIIRSVLSVGSH